MINYLNQQQHDAEMARRISARLEAEESERMRQEQAEAQAREAQAWNQIYADRDKAEAHAVARLQALGASYAERERLAREAIQALAKFQQVEVSIRSVLDSIDGELQPHWARTVSEFKRQERWQGLRTTAGLAETHGELRLDQARDDSTQLAQTAIKGIVAGMIGPGVVRVGTKAITF